MQGMDISADLTELGRTVSISKTFAYPSIHMTKQPVTVVCAGAKSILDIPRTLEFLETQGVCVTTYGDRAEFPAFYTPSTGIKVGSTFGLARHSTYVNRRNGL